MSSASARNTFLSFLLLFFMAGVNIVSCGKTKKQFEMQNRFQAEVERIIEDYRFPGMTAAYVLSDGTTGESSAGFSDIEKMIPMSSESRMLAASIGKTFTAAVVLDLVHEGKLDLDAPIRNYLNEEKWFLHLPNHNKITLRHLLTHSSGIENHISSHEFIRRIKNNFTDDEELPAPEELISYIMDVPAKFMPGNGFYYSDTGYIITGLVIEKATGKTLFDEVQTRILTPLELKHTEPSDRKNLPGLASGYISKENIFHLPEKTTSGPGMMIWNPGIEWAGGGLISTSMDLSIWGKMLYEGKALKGGYLKDILKSVNAGPDAKYGIATSIKEGKYGTVYGHRGWIPGYCSSMMYYKNHKASIAFQINTDIGIIGGKKDLLAEIENRLLQSLFAE